MYLLATQTSQNVDMVPLIPVFVVLGLGFLLWSAGRRVLRFGFVLMGLTIGGGLGYLAGVEFVNQIPPWVIAVFSGLVLGGFALMFYKLFIAAVLAAIVGLTLPVAVSSAHENGWIDLEEMFESVAEDDLSAEQTDGAAEETDDRSLDPDAFTPFADPLESDEPAEEEPVDVMSQLEEALRLFENGEEGKAWMLVKEIPREDLEKFLQGQPEDQQAKLRALHDPTIGNLGNMMWNELAPADRERISRAADEVGGFVDKIEISETTQKELARLADHVLNAIQAQVEYVIDQPGGVRTGMLAAAVIGAAFGFFIGVAASGFSAFVVTAVTGAMFVLLSSWLVLCEFGQQEQSWLPSGSGAWLIVWLITALVGFMIQWTFRPRKADKSG